MQSYHLIITGKVQGVFYRQTAKEVAIKHGLTGWVRNNDDGNVEVVICGEENTLMHFIEWSKLGPKAARVRNVAVHKIEPQNFDDFAILRN